MTQPFRGDREVAHQRRTTEEFPDSRVLAEFCQQYHLTPRERQILTLVCQGLKNAQIGIDLGVSNATIRLHIGNIHRKLNTASKVDLVLKLWKWSAGVGDPDNG